MADFYAGLQNTANSLLADKGQDIVFTRIVSEYDPIEGHETIGTNQVQTLKGVQFPTTKAKLAKFDNGRLKDLVLSKTRFVMVSGKGATFAPQAGDICTLENKNWSVLGCTPLRPDGKTDVTYNIAMHETAREVS